LRAVASTLKEYNIEDAEITVIRADNKSELYKRDAKGGYHRGTNVSLPTPFIPVAETLEQQGQKAANYPTPILNDDKVEQLVSYAPLDVQLAPGTAGPEKFGVMVAVPESEAYASIFSMQRWISIVLLACLVVTVALGLYLGRSFVSPLLQIM